MYGNTKKEENHKPGEDKTMINQGVEFVYGSI
jgi:hypothetical protein